MVLKKERVVKKGLKFLIPFVFFSKTKLLS